jgi:peptide/nickel transport system substrate-binding protein
VGIKASIERMADAELFGRFRGRNFDALVIEWRVGVPHAHDILSTHAVNPDNRDEAKLTQMPAWRGSWYRPEFNELVKQAAFESDPNQQIQMYHTIQYRHMQEGPYTYLFQKISNFAVRKEVTAFPAHAFRVYYDKVTK